MKKSTRKRNHTIMSYIIITLGIMLYVFAWSVFLVPKEIGGGGVTGMSSIIYFLSGKVIPIGISNLIINCIFFLIGLKLLGAKFGVNTIYGIFAMAGMFILFQQVLKIQDHIDASSFEPFMCAVIGGGLAGAGVGLAFSRGGNTGGTDIVALIVTKYYNVSPGKVILFLDIFIIGCSYFVSHSIEKVVYGYVQLGVMAYALDLVVEGSRQSYQIMVFSKHTQKIAEKVANQVGRGVTLLNASGWYSKAQQEVLLVLARKTDRSAILEIIHEEDPQAFISIAKAQGVYGQNFDKLKI